MIWCLSFRPRAGQPHFLVRGSRWTKDGQSQRLAHAQQIFPGQRRGAILHLFLPKQMRVSGLSFRTPGSTCKHSFSPRPLAVTRTPLRLHGGRVCPFKMAEPTSSLLAPSSLGQHILGPSRCWETSRSCGKRALTFLTYFPLVHRGSPAPAQHSPHHPLRMSSLGGGGFICGFSTASILRPGS